eukprot:2314119-Prymnesium_polylepis.2
MRRPRSGDASPMIIGHLVPAVMTWATTAMVIATPQSMVVTRGLDVNLVWQKATTLKNWTRVATAAVTLQPKRRWLRRTDSGTTSEEKEVLQVHVSATLRGPAALEKGRDAVQGQSTGRLLPMHRRNPERLQRNSSTSCSQLWPVPTAHSQGRPLASQSLPAARSVMTLCGLATQVDECARAPVRLWCWTDCSSVLPGPVPKVSDLRHPKA